MKDPIDVVVCGAIAQHLAIDANSILPQHRFDRDLSLRPLDVVLIALLLEDTEKVDLPIDRLETIETVAELTMLFRSVVAATRSRIERSSSGCRRRKREIRRSLWRSFRYG